MAIKCHATNSSNGNRCKKDAIAGTFFCATHRNQQVNKTDSLDSEMCNEETIVTPTKPSNENQVSSNSELIEKINTMENSIQELTQLVMTMKLSVNKTGSTVKRTRKATVLSKALVLFYHDNKNNVSVKTELKKRNIPFETKTKKNIDGTTETYESYNWLRVKKLTDELFNEYTDETVKNQYMEKARLVLENEATQAQA